APWKLAKDATQRAELDATMAALVRHLARHCVLLFPFMPEKTAALWQALGAPGELSAQRHENLRTVDASGWRVTKPAPLFPKEASKETRS
ncbi:MAG: methionine--tRNA ligase, partial [Gemmatimonadaceae bacterium]